VKQHLKQELVQVLFVCLGNACRSPMAEAIARRDAAGVLSASSAGIIPLGYVVEMTKRTLEQNGYSPEGLESKAISRQAWEAADLVINMSGRARELAFREFAKVEDWEVEDPYGADPEIYQRIFEEIERRVQQLTERVRSGQGIREAGK
jgi:protein-tyrosine-phosphatase